MRIPSGEDWQSLPSDEHLDGSSSGSRGESLSVGDREVDADGSWTLGPECGENCEVVSVVVSVESLKRET
jgi:hypothetical protein